VSAQYCTSHVSRYLVVVGAFVFVWNGLSADVDTVWIAGLISCINYTLFASVSENLTVTIFYASAKVMQPKALCYWAVHASMRPSVRAS